MTITIGLMVAGIGLFCAGYAIGHAAGAAAARDLRGAIAREIARSVIEIDEIERKQEENRNKSAKNEMFPRNFQRDKDLAIMKQETE